jgi:MFS family permease
VEALDQGGGRHVLAVPDFRRLLLVGLSLSIARWLEMLVIGLLVLQATGSAFLVAAMTLLRLLPMGVFGALIGVLADRMPRRRSLLGVLAMQATAAAALTLLAAADALEVWHMALASFAGGLGWATDNPVRRMLVGESVGQARMGPAMSLDVVANNASRVTGPALGGTLLALAGPEAAFGVALLCYLAAIAAAFGTRVGATAAPPRRTPVLREMRESFALALADPRLRAVMVVTVMFNLFAWPNTAMVPVIGRVSLGLGVEGVGLLASMDGAGALAGAALVALLARPHRYARIYVGGLLLYLVALIGLALSTSPVIAGVMLFFAGMGGAGFATMQATLVYAAAPPELRGRALGVLSTAIGSGLLGYLQVGLLADWLGAATATALVASQGLLAMAITWRWWRAVFRLG